MPGEPQDIECDVLVVGSGSAGLSAALRCAAGRLRVTILEKSELLGGTSAMSGSGTWIPANHHAAEAGIEDSPQEALKYLRAASPEGWESDEDALWQAFAQNAPRTLAFLEEATPLRFRLTKEPDIFPECPGGKVRGRMVSPLPLRRSLLGEYARKLRPSTLRHLYTYHEVYDGDLYHHPFRASLRVAPQLIWRVLTGARAQGTALVTGLLKGCLDRGCDIALNTRVSEILLDEDGAVSGVLADCAGGVRRYRARRGVVLATGGFEWSAEMRNAHFPGPLDYLGSPRTNEGDGQRLAASVGARLDRMDQANVYPAMPTYYQGKPHGIPLLFHAEPHAIVVDRNAKRFTSELAFNIGEALDRRDPVTGEPMHLPAWVIADSRFVGLSLPFRWYARKKPGWLVKAASVRELAARIGLPPEALDETVTRYNGFCASGEDLDFRRGASAWEKFKAGSKDVLGSVEVGPFYAMPFNRSILGTKGGARTNDRGQVLRPDGSVIAGLYAAGLAMANPIGTRAVGPGTTIGPNLTWGFICGNSLRTDNRS